MASFTAAVSGMYEIVAIGAEGGVGSGHPGGFGAMIADDFNLNSGEMLTLLIGGQGASGSGGGAGGGGTFVAFGNTPLLVAGGGGGSSLYMRGSNASTGINGVDGNAAAGTNGNGGVGDEFGGGGGGGFLTDGGNGRFTKGGLSFLHGGTGGTGGGCCGARGGIGGGGGSDNGGSGGGGYSGGGGGSNDLGGGGGGSYDAGLMGTDYVDEILTAAVNGGDGELTITLKSASPTPEPGSFWMAGAALLALSRLAKRKSSMPE